MSERAEKPAGQGRSLGCCYILLGGFLLVLVLYVSSYAWLSVHGIYKPGCIGTNGVKWYEWHPRGLFAEQRGPTVLAYVYLPLLYLDGRYWHDPGKADTGRYPVDRSWERKHKGIMWSRSGSDQPPPEPKP